MDDDQYVFHNPVTGEFEIRRSPGSTDELRRQRAEEERRAAAESAVQPQRRRQTAYAEERRRQRAARRISHPEPSSSRPTERSATNPGGGTTIHVRQSVLYSNRPRVSRSRRGREVSPNKIPAEECAREVSSSEGPIITDLPEFKEAALNELSPKLQSPYWCNLPYTDSSDSESETVEGNPDEESDFDLEKELQKLEEYLEAHTSDTISEGMDKILAAERATLAAEFEKFSAAKRADITARAPYFANRLPPTWRLPSPAGSEAQSLQATEQASSAEPSPQHLLRRQPRRGVSKEEIIQNGKNWMKKEVMLAFDEYKERSSNLKGLDCQFEKLGHQCFHVEHYSKIFHHFNFFVKITDPSSSDSRVALFFAEVKEIFGRTYYFCCPLEQNENGRCNACHNQEMDDLQHPATGGYERGLTDTVFPFMYEDDSDSS